MGTKWSAASVPNCFYDNSLSLLSVCNSLSCDPAFLHRRFISVIVLILCTNGSYCSKAATSPHLPLQISKDCNNRTLKTLFFFPCGCRMWYPTVMETTHAMCVYVCVRALAHALERCDAWNKTFKPKREEEDNGGNRISRVILHKMSCWST